MATTRLMNWFFNTIKLLLTKESFILWQAFLQHVSVTNCLLMLTVVLNGKGNNYFDLKLI